MLADDPENHAIRWQLNSALPNVLTLANGNQLVATTALRAYVNQQITVNVTAIDNGVPNAASSALLSVLVASVEEAPLAVIVTNLSPVPETASLGTTVAVLEAQDADLTSNVTLRLTATGFGRFSITPTVCRVRLSTGPLARLHAHCRLVTGQQQHAAAALHGSRADGRAIGLRVPNQVASVGDG